MGIDAHGLQVYFVLFVMKFFSFSHCDGQEQQHPVSWAKRCGRHSGARADEKAHMLAPNLVESDLVHVLCGPIHLGWLRLEDVERKSGASKRRSVKCNEENNLPFREGVVWQGLFCFLII